MEARESKLQRLVQSLEIISHSLQQQRVLPADLAAGHQVLVGEQVHDESKCQAVQATVQRGWYQVLPHKPKHNTG